MGRALRALPEGMDMPWQRVVNAQGQISTRGRGADEVARQRRLLRQV